MLWTIAERCITVKALCYITTLDKLRVNALDCAIKIFSEVP
jgi:hypothetical protein